MEPSVESDRRSRRGPLVRSRLAALALAAAAVVLLPACSEQAQRGFLPADSVNATDYTERITDLWNGSWIAALVLGVITWGLMLWAAYAFRRRSSDEGMPAQIRYHVPLEIMYTAVPTIIILVLFYFTARDQAEVLSLDDDGQPVDLTVEVVGKQWSWDFNYLDYDVYDTGRQAELGAPGVDERIPTLYLPVDQRVEFKVYARDVAHSFWVPAFLFKMDALPGRENTFQVTPTKEGSFVGRCAELCGQYHSEMLFDVEVVSQDEFDQHVEELRAAGQTGALSVDLGRSDVVPGQDGGGVYGDGGRPDDQGGSFGDDGSTDDGEGGDGTGGQPSSASQDEEG